MPTETVQQQYDRARKRVARMSAWLTGPAGMDLPDAEWNERFEKYQEELKELRRLGELMKPSTAMEHVDG